MLASRSDANALMSRYVRRDGPATRKTSVGRCDVTSKNVCGNSECQHPKVWRVRSHLTTEVWLACFECGLEVLKDEAVYIEDIPMPREDLYIRNDCLS